MLTLHGPFRILVEHVHLASTMIQAVFPGGRGGVRLQGIQLASAMRLRSLAIDTGAGKEKLCKEVGGAQHFIESRKVENVAREVVRICDRISAHGVFVTAVQSYPSSVSYFFKQKINSTLTSSMVDVDKT